MPSANLKATAASMKHFCLSNFLLYMSQIIIILYTKQPSNNTSAQKPFLSICVHSRMSCKVRCCWQFPLLRLIAEDTKKTFSPFCFSVKVGSQQTTNRKHIYYFSLELHAILTVLPDKIPTFVVDVSGRVGGWLVLASQSALRRRYSFKVKINEFDEELNILDVFFVD